MTRFFRGTVTCRKALASRNKCLHKVSSRRYFGVCITYSRTHSIVEDFWKHQNMTTQLQLITIIIIIIIMFSHILCPSSVPPPPQLTSLYARKMGKFERSRRVLRWGILAYWNPHVNNHFRSQFRRRAKLVLSWPAQTLGSRVPIRNWRRTHCVISSCAGTDFTVSQSTNCWVSKTSWFQQLILTLNNPVKVENWEV